MGRKSAGDSGSVIFVMRHSLALFNFFTDCFEIWLFIVCGNGDAMYSATGLIKDIAILSKPVKQSLRMFFIILSTSPRFVVG